VQLVITQLQLLPVEPVFVLQIAIIVPLQRHVSLVMVAPILMEDANKVTTPLAQELVPLVD
jgi:hypothetical protein